MVIMALAASQPVVRLAETALRAVASLGRGTPAAWWLAILLVGPLIGSFITEPAAMTICALLLSRKFYALEPSRALAYGTLGLLFVNISIGGTLTHFAAPPVLMVVRTWGWDSTFVFTHVGQWKAHRGASSRRTASTTWHFGCERPPVAARPARQPPPRGARRRDRGRNPAAGAGVGGDARPRQMFVAWTVLNAHYPPLFIGGFLFFLGFVKATSPLSRPRGELRPPLLVGFFLAGLVVHGGLQGWWIGPVLSSLGEFPLYLGATVLTAFNDNALITYLATLVPDLSEPFRLAVVQGAVTGGGLTVIANAPNPAGYALLSRFFGGSLSPLGLMCGALLPTIIAALAFRLFA